jgi:hypothetical protein
MEKIAIVKINPIGKDKDIDEWFGENRMMHKRDYVARKLGYDKNGYQNIKYTFSTWIKDEIIFEFKMKFI